MLTIDELPESEMIELEPASQPGLAGADRGLVRGVLPIAAVSLVEQTIASRTGETDTLRRSRLLAAAACLAATFGLLLIWVFASDNPGTLTVEGSRYSLRVGLIGAALPARGGRRGSPGQRGAALAQAAPRWSSTRCFWA